ncbi:SRPBCC family protein [Robiginitalea sp. M366]|uniref:SRPBCC family protein n=1 Tax=Robiginitalea aestuariiviva TaxID=3036903 RepID=UPI00240DEAE9|nr:SRPBCC family protein [Robiginitalea aestuariiviva]MDG1572784.1 SRPBCC family protein [Robiginitalea aestuariiviva]
MEEAWAFLSNPFNLQEITPPQMNFDIRCDGTQPMYAGQVIHYIVSPFKGFKTRWVTEITHVHEGRFFVDEQRFGPYKFWHHKHLIEPVEGGVRMWDIVDYAPPLGVLGRLAHAIFVKSQLRTIFRFRETALETRFGKLEGRPTLLRMQTI